MHAGTTAELVFDRAQALESLGGDEELLANVASLFVDEAVSYRQALIDALAAGDAATLQREAHTVKSVLATFAYEAGRERALRLEQLAASGNLEAAKAATDEVIAALQTLSEVLRRRKQRPLAERSGLHSPPFRVPDYFSIAWMMFSAAEIRLSRSADGGLSRTSEQQAANSPSKIVFSISSILMPSLRSS